MPGVLSAKTAQMQEKYARYCELRDAGTLPTDCRREVGIGESTGRKYERAWRALQGVAPTSRRRWNLPL